MRSNDVAITARTPNNNVPLAFPVNNLKETFSITGLNGGNAKEVTVIAKGDNGDEKTFKAQVRLDTPKERDYFQNGGILHYVLRQLAA